MATNWLNSGLKNRYSHTTRSLGRLYNLIYEGATREYVPTVLTAFRTGEDIEVRADLVNEGSENKWVKYQPDQHGYIVFGNFLDRSLTYGCFIKEGEQLEFLDQYEGIKFGEETNLVYRNSTKLKYKRTRDDVRPSKGGSTHEHDWKPTQAPLEHTHFSFKYWVQSPINESREQISP